jgi:16S rRNA (adenine1518-N6/adenine1519-N6)-dimethyltransferase
VKLEELKSRMAALEVRSKRSLGQNFLVSELVIDEIIEAAKKAKPDFVLEVGPGLGALTDGLKHLKPMLIELDKDLAAHWREQDFEVIEKDALKVDWDSLKLPANTLLVSNLPYQISTHIVVDRCFGPKNITNMVLMFQKEVAQRLAALPRSENYGLLSVMAQTFWKIKKLVDAAPRDFHPSPRVASRVLTFQRLETEMDRGFLSFLKVSFEHRRKFLLKNLKALGNKKTVTFEDLFQEMGLNVKARAEELSPTQFVDLYRRWKEK